MKLLLTDWFPNDYSLDVRSKLLIHFKDPQQLCFIGKHIDRNLKSRDFEFN